jgi:hypothetical protein
MKVQDMSYDMLVTTKAITLIMLDDNKTGIDLLKGLADRQQDPELKEVTLAFMKSKNELIEMMTNFQYSR